MTMRGGWASATNPENGTVTYTYNSDNTLQYKHDAKGQDTVYTYDSQKRVTMIQRYPTGKSNAEDTCQRVTYSYDTNPYSTTFSQYTTGRLTAAKYYAGCLQLMTEMYSYHPAGAVTGKSLQVGTAGTMAVAYGYNTAGQVTTMQYPTTGAGWWTFNYGYDSMGRPSSLNETLPGSPSSSWVPAAQYDLAGRMSSLQYAAGAVYQGNNLVTVYTQETMGYNVNGQLTSLNWGGAPGSPAYPSVGPVGGIQYSYPATGNNGQIAQAVDSLSGETITYSYDSLKRLTSATSTPLAGGAPSGWAETFGYDGFGNLTSKVLNGTSAPIAVNAGTNQLSNAIYDANGNMTSGAGATLTYDVANRLASAAEVSGGVEHYGYAPDNKRVLRLLGNGQQEITFYGARGEKLATGTINSAGILSTVSQSVWFGGRLIWDAGVTVYADRVGTNRGSGAGSTSSPPYMNNVARFLPYGEELTSTSNDREKFGTYKRDSYTGLDYADQRFYASTYGRFNTPDPARSAKLREPLTWNRYSYVVGDPVTKHDPKGLCYTSPDGEVWEDDAWDTVAWDYGGTDSYVAYSPGPCADFYADAYTYDTTTDAGQLAYAQSVIQSVNGLNPGGLLKNFMAYSAAAGLGAYETLNASFAFADGASAAESIMLGPSTAINPTTGLVYSGYVEIGGTLGADTLSMTPAQWVALGTEGQNATMAGFIDGAIQRGAQIVFTSDPSLAAATGNAGTAFEYNYITQTLGKQVIQKGTSWVVVY